MRLPAEELPGPGEGGRLRGEWGAAVLPTPRAYGHWPLQRMKASESARLRAESTLREELEGRWQQLQELDKERVRAQQGQCQVGEGRCRGRGCTRLGDSVPGPLHLAAGRVPPPGAVPGTGQGRGPAD